MACDLTFDLETATGGTALALSPDRLIVAGWTGRDRDAMLEHIRELEALGIPRPASTPIFYRVAASRLTQAPAIQVPGGGSSGEAEVLLLQAEGRLLVGLGSDHTDREAERQGITLAKQLCDKPLARGLWPFEEVQPHWDRLELRSWIEEEGGERLYQEGTLAAMLPPEELLAGLQAVEAPLADRSLLFCGTLPALGGVRPAPAFRCRLSDPVLARRIELSYRIETLPDRG